MTERISCELVDRASLAERYVARKMDEGERVGFENHFVACADCQRDVAFAESIRVGVAAAPQAGDRAGPLSTTARRTAPWTRGRIARFSGAGIAVAAGIVAVVMLRGSTSPELARLGGVAEAPIYLGVAVRGTPAREDSVFERAMDAYRAKSYAAAAGGFRAALAAGEDSVPAEFFLGASALMSNDARAAFESFGRVLARDDTPYRDESQLYGAKALLRLGRARDAVELLTSRKPADPLLALSISALADSVTRLTSH